MKHIKALIRTTLFLLLPFNHLHCQQREEIKEGISVERLKRYENYIKSEIDKEKIQGAVSLIQRNGKIVYSTALGLSNIGKETPMNLDNIFDIQSLTKPIISVAFMMLYEEGHFLLTDPVSMYLPEFKDLKVIRDVEDGINGETEPLKSEITIFNLLTHTAGFSGGFGTSKYHQEFMKVRRQNYPDVRSRVDSLLKIPLVGHPNEQWEYSMSTDILSVLIEHFSGQTTADFLTNRLFEPLKMNHTGYNVSKEDQSQVVELYEVNNNGDLVLSANQPKVDENTIWGGVAGLFSTAADYLNFCQMLLNGGKWEGKRLLSESTIRMMTADHVGSLFNHPGMGCGFGFAVVTSITETQLLGSNGIYYWSGAYNSHFFIDPKKNMVAIFMTQTRPHDLYYHYKMRQLIYQAVVD